MKLICLLCSLTQVLSIKREGSAIRVNVGKKTREKFAIASIGPTFPLLLPLKAQYIVVELNVFAKQQ